MEKQLLVNWATKWTQKKGIVMVLNISEGQWLSLVSETSRNYKSKLHNLSSIRQHSQQMHSRSSMIKKMLECQCDCHQLLDSFLLLHLLNSIFVDCDCWCYFLVIFCSKGHHEDSRKCLPFATKQCFSSTDTSLWYSHCCCWIYCMMELWEQWVVNLGWAILEVHIGPDLMFISPLKVVEYW